LAQRASVAHKTIADFELGLRRPYERTLKDVVAAFEAGGAVFIEPQENVRGGGVALRWGIDTTSLSAKIDDDNEISVQKGKGSHSANCGRDVTCSGDDEPQDILEQRAFWAAHPHRWDKLSETGKAVLNRALDFGTGTDHG
jgi:hypothetical protein